MLSVLCFTFSEAFFSSISSMKPFLTPAVYSAPHSADLLQLLSSMSSIPAYSLLHVIHVYVCVNIYIYKILACFICFWIGSVSVPLQIVVLLIL